MFSSRQLSVGERTKAAPLVLRYHVTRHLCPWVAPRDNLNMSHHTVRIAVSSR